MEAGYTKIERVCPPKFTTDKVTTLKSVLINSYLQCLNTESQTTPENQKGKEKEKKMEKEKHPPEKWATDIISQFNEEEPQVAGRYMN